MVKFYPNIEKETNDGKVSSRKCVKKNDNHKKTSFASSVQFSSFTSVYYI